VKKRVFLVVSLLFLMAVLTGCMEYDQAITAESEGFWNEYIVYPLSWLIVKMAELLGGSFGLSIIVVTLIIRLAILPLMIKQTKSSKAMQVIQPEMKKLQEKHSSKDQKTQQKLQQETMALFQEHGVNPLAGCFPLIVQMPILIGFYHAISRTREIAQHNFLWFDLGSPDPYYALPIIAGITTFIQQKMTPTVGDPAQAKIMLIMPVMFTFMFLSFPSGLVLYWLVTNVLSIGQQYYINKHSF